MDVVPEKLWRSLSPGSIGWKRIPAWERCAWVSVVACLVLATPGLAASKGLWAKSPGLLFPAAVLSWIVLTLRSLREPRSPRVAHEVMWAGVLAVLPAVMFGLFASWLLMPDHSWHKSFRALERVLVIPLPLAAWGGAVLLCWLTTAWLRLRRPLAEEEARQLLEEHGAYEPEFQELSRELMSGGSPQRRVPSPPGPAPPHEQPGPGEATS